MILVLFLDTLFISEIEFGYLLLVTICHPKRIARYCSGAGCDHHPTRSQELITMPHTVLFERRALSRESLCNDVFVQET
jgi:hypothetical protein